MTKSGSLEKLERKKTRSTPPPIWWIGTSFVLCHCSIAGRISRAPPTRQWRCKPTAEGGTLSLGTGSPSGRGEGTARTVGPWPKGVSVNHSCRGTPCFGTGWLKCWQAENDSMRRVRGPCTGHRRATVSAIGMRATGPKLLAPEKQRSPSKVLHGRGAPWGGQSGANRSVSLRASASICGSPWMVTPIGSGCGTNPR